MYSRSHGVSVEFMQRLRNQSGLWLRQLRERRGLSQRELARRVGVPLYTFISQIEHGRGRIPPDRYLVWATALGVEPREFVRELMSYYDPVTYSIVFGDVSDAKHSQSSTIVRLPKRPRSASATNRPR
jgi:transcriptional regulator with XRE-family HTH domain